jgi:hypothetical protein
MRGPLDVLYNFHVVVPGEAARAAQTYAGGLRGLLRRHGIAAMLNLRGPNPKWGWWRYETAVCQELGVTHLDLVLDSRHLPTTAMLTALLGAFDTVPKPFLAKCSGGQDRTSLASALYILHRDGWRAVERARGQFARWPYLHFPKPEQRWLKLFLDFAQADANGAPIAQWARARYTAERFRDWLEANGHAGTYRAIFTRRAPANKWQR